MVISFFAKHGVFSSVCITSAKQHRGLDHQSCFQKKNNFYSIIIISNHNRVKQADATLIVCYQSCFQGNFFYLITIISNHNRVKPADATLIIFAVSYRGSLLSNSICSIHDTHCRMCKKFSHRELIKCRCCLVP